MEMVLVVVVVLEVVLVVGLGLVYCMDTSTLLYCVGNSTWFRG